jgi:glycosyltransferase involved in cell wall biosynthesis
VGPFPPHRSGLAGHAGELARALRRELDVVVCAIDRYGLSYPDDVVVVVAQDRLADYRRAARVLAEHRVDAVLIQYDGAAYGGPAGAHLLDLTHELRLRDIPYLVHLHSLRRPADQAWLRTVAALSQGAARVLVTTQAARTQVVSRHLVDPDRVRVVQVGAPALATPSAPPVRPALVDALAGAGLVVSTVGSIRPGKGLDAALVALAKVVAAGREVRYVVAGSGDGYADDLRDQAARLGLDGTVRIVDTYLSPGEVAALLARTDLYLAPCLPPDHTWSGPLAGAVAAGCAIVAGEHPYPVELLGARGAHPAGLVVPATADDLAAAVLTLLDDPRTANAMRDAATRVARTLDGTRVARRLAGLLREVVRPAAGKSGVRVDALPTWLSTVDLEASPATALDARRAVVAADVLVARPELIPPRAWSAAAESAQRSLRRFAAARAEADETLAGQAIWAGGTLTGRPGVPEPIREEARALCESWFDRLPTAPLPAAYACLGLTASARSMRPGSARARSGWAHALEPMVERAAAHLDAAILRAGRGAAWPWFTARLDGEGVRVPQALIAAGLWLRDPAMVRRGLFGLDWYVSRAGLASADGVLRLPWSGAGIEPAADAGAAVEALVLGHAATGSSHYARLAVRAWQWFLGANRHAEPVYDADAGWCGIGLLPQAPDRTADGRLSIMDGPASALDVMDTRQSLVPATLAFAGATLALAGAGLLSLPAAPLLAAA